MKNTKKLMVVLLALMLVLSFTLAACGGNEDPTGTTTKPQGGEPSNSTPASSSQTDPTGTLTITVTPDTVTMYAGEEIDLLLGVSVDNENATLRISDSGDFDETTPGTYTITYEATLGDVKVTATRTVIVQEALSNLTLEVVKNNMTAGKWEGVLMSFQHAQYHELNADFTTTEALTGVFKNTSDQPIQVTIGGKNGEVAIVDANGVVIEGRDGANGKLVNAENPIRANSPGPNATIVVDGEEVKMADNFAKALTVPAGGYVVVVQTGAFGEGFDFDGRGFMAQSVIHQVGNVIRLYWTDTQEMLTQYVNQKPAVSGNNKVLALMGDTGFVLEEAIKVGLVATDDNGTFENTDDVKIQEFTVVNDGGFNINEVGTYTVTLSVTDGELTTEFTRDVEVKSDGIGTLVVGNEDNKMNIALDRVAFNEELTKLGNYAFLVYTKEFKGTMIANGYGIAFILDEYGVLVRIYDGANAKYYDAEHPEGVADSNFVTSANYLNEAFASLQDGETMLAAINNGDNLHRAFLGSAASKIIGNKVSGLGMEFKTTDMTITVNGQETTVAEGKWLYNTAVTKAEAANYQMIIYDKKFTGTFETNGYGCALVLDQYGVLVKIYDGANGGCGFWTKDGKAEGPYTFDNNTYAMVAWSELQEGETLVIFLNSTAGNEHRGWALDLRTKNPSIGEVATLTGFKFAEKPVTTKTITVNGQETTIAEGKWLYNTAVTKAEAANYQMIIYDKKFTGTFETNGYGCALVLDQYGVLVKIYDGANGGCGFWTKDGKAEGPYTFDNNTYAMVAWSELQEGETLVIFPNSTAGNEHRGWALDLRAKNPSIGEVATLTGFEFKKKEN